ncbi:ATP-binding protein [Luteimonas terricola]|uniref:histidine kinase n=1 Tax=Luteimonas terricola TaxID=645597 RepID=A0ABQ2EBV3_9GAMM|nr:ATP-binding protein [Luteimonas terricola]GGK05855.1 two-component sensor histidine kinase [Luteimonas terricola]
MSLRLRLVLTIGIALAVLWSGAALWMLRDLDRHLQQTLDERLSMSARMVSGLLAQSRIGEGGAPAMSMRDAITVPGSRGMACQIRSLRGEVVAMTRGAPDMVMAAAARGYRTQTVDGVRWRTYTLQSDGYSITTADSLDERASLRRGIAFAAGLPFLIAAAGGLLALWVGASRGLAPLDQLRRTLAHRQPDTIEPLEARSLPTELRPLIDSLNRLLQRIAQAVHRERSFTNDAAHELRTPLTAIDTHLQVARLTTGSEARQALADADEGVRRMRATLDQLLMLARVEGRLPFDEGELISADEVVRRVIAASAPEAAARVACRGDGGAAMVAVPPALAVVALRNLTDNALRYSPPGSQVEVVTESDGANVRFRVIDQGSGFSLDDRGQAMQRFWRGRGRDSSGSGLGLAIVDAIATRYGGNIALGPGDGGGTVAELVFPRQQEPSMDFRWR